jgi:hypothetical protein
MCRDPPNRLEKAPLQAGRLLAERSTPPGLNASSEAQPDLRKESNIMKRVFVVAALALSALLVMASAASAQNPHFKRNGSPVCTVTVSGNSAGTSCSGALAGLGNDDLLLELTTSGDAVYQCQNAGGNTAPGQNRVLIGPSVTPVLIPADEIKNGNLAFSIANTLTAPATVTGAEAGCPNPNWTGVNPVVRVTSIMLDIEQPPGTLIFSCTASNTSGLSGTVALTCV